MYEFWLFEEARMRLTDPDLLGSQPEALPEDDAPAGDALLPGWRHAAASALHRLARAIEPPPGAGDTASSVLS